MASPSTTNVRTAPPPRWTSRAQFLFTSLLLLATLGGPLQVTRGLLEHGVLFLPALLGLTWLLGLPLVRIALALGQYDPDLPGREAVIPVQSLLRVLLAAAALWMGARAATWIFAEHLFRPAGDLLEYQRHGLSDAHAAWHGLWTPAWGAGLCACGAFVLVFWLAFARRGLPGLAWLAPPLLIALMIPALGGVLIGLFSPETGALAALATPVDLRAPLRAVFWADAAWIALLGCGALSGVLVAAGEALPSRAELAREARILVAGSTLMLALCGVAGVLMLSALGGEQGWLPEARHAGALLVTLDLVPALLRQVAAATDAWPAWLPDSRRLTLLWAFVVAMSGVFTATSLILARPLWPARGARMGALLGGGAALIALVGALGARFAGFDRALDVLIAMLMLMLALLRVTLPVRTNAGLRVASVAIGDRSALWQRVNSFVAFSLVRFVLLALIACTAWTYLGQTLLLGPLAITLGLLYVGTLQRRREGQLLVSARSPLNFALAGCAVLLGMLACMALAAGAGARTQTALNTGLAPARMQASELDTTSDAQGALERWITQAQADRWAREWPRLPLELQELRQRVAGPEGQPPPGERARRLALRALLEVDPGLEAENLERALLVPSARDAARLLEHFDGTRPRDVAALTAALRDLRQRLGLREKGEEDPARELALLCRDMRAAFGTSGVEGRLVRRALLRQALRERTLLVPDLGAGAWMIACLVASGVLLAWALAASGAREPGVERNGPPI